MPQECYQLIKGDADTAPLRVWHDNADVIVMQGSGDAAHIVRMRPDKVLTASARSAPCAAEKASI